MDPGRSEAREQWRISEGNCKGNGIAQDFPRLLGHRRTSGKKDNPMTEKLPSGKWKLTSQMEDYNTIESINNRCCGSTEINQKSFRDRFPWTSLNRKQS